jgi:hypothetical protein
MTYITKSTNVSVEWILKNVTYSVDGYNRCSEHDIYGYQCLSTCVSEIDWQKMIDYKFWDTDLEMMYSILSDGIRKPICLRHSGDNRWTQGNGHHRLATAILAGLDSIPVVFSFDSEYMMDWITD